jgi:RNA polymerase sigma factor (sigma-70 family)
MGDAGRVRARLVLRCLLMDSGMDSNMSRMVYSRAPISSMNDVLGFDAAGVESSRAAMPEPEKLLLENLARIEQIIASIGRRKGMDAEEIEEFSADAKLRLISDDYAIIRAFQGRSSFITYMGAVVPRLLLDYRNRKWGKWHASAEAEKLGRVAIELEQLLYRDGRSIDEAFTELARKFPGLSRAEVDAFVLRLPRRTRRRTVDLDEAMAIGTTGDADSFVTAESAARISAVVSECIGQLPEDDQLLLRLRFDSEMTVAQISRSLHIDQQLLYRRLYKLFEELRTLLERGGVAAQDVADLIGKDSVVLDFRTKKRKSRPSDEEESGAAGPRKETP